jgi:hypothetical protein
MAERKERRLVIPKVQSFERKTLTLRGQRIYIPKVVIPKVRTTFR